MNSMTEAREPMYKPRFVIMLLFLTIIAIGVWALPTPTLAAGVKARGHVTNIGWMPYQQANTPTIIEIGTTGKNLPLEAVQISLLDFIPECSIEYQVHARNKGWMPVVKDGQVGGTVGEVRALEAISICIKNSPYPDYQVEYQAHVQNIGWMNWVPAGSIAGTTGRVLNLEAIRIRIIPAAAPSPMAHLYSYNANAGNNFTPYRDYLWIGMDTPVVPPKYDIWRHENESASAARYAMLSLAAPAGRGLA